MNAQGGIPDLSSLFSRVTENPQALTMLSSLLGGGMKNTSAKEEDEQKNASEEEKKAMPVFLAQEGRQNHRHEDKRRLLLALKPFLSQERRQALETILVVLDAISMLPQRKEPPCT